jgi:16S rRNA A1518/A1519 N6-dimethyltransferase RsmA/KsgA/DIM1 with predicted DNA glycosylase/AP lyase activity
MDWQQQDAVNAIEIESRLVEPDMQTNRDEGINRNLQLGNINKKDLFRLQALEEHAMILSRVPTCLGGDIFDKWAKDTRAKKHHFLVLSGSDRGFVRRMARTNISEGKMQTEQSGGLFSGLIKSKKSNGGNY